MTADIVFPAAKIAVFADGCYWHGCPRHPRTEPRGPNREIWVAKFERIGYRERRVAELLARLGFEVMRVWECEILTDVDTTAERIERVVRSRTRPRRSMRAEEAAFGVHPKSKQSAKVRELGARHGRALGTRARA